MQVFKTTLRTKAVLLSPFQRRSFEAFSDVGTSSRAVERAKSVFHSAKALNIKHKHTYKTVNLRFGQDARASIVRGIQRLAQTAILTLGPGGRNVALEYEAGDPKITKDGVTVVKSVIEPDRAQDIGARMMKKVAGNTNLYAGDGTTTATLMASELLKGGYQAVDITGAHPVALKKGMEIALQVVIDFLKDMTMPVSSEDEIFNVCMVSSNYDSLIARIVAKTMITVGLNGSVNIVESPTGETRFNLVNGLIYDRGLVTDAFATEFKVEQRCEMEYPLVLVVTNKITDVKEITHILDLVKKTKKSLVVFSEDLQEEPLSMMVYNNSKDIIKCCAINVPWMANMQKEMLTDIAVATGATLIDNEFEIKLKDVTLEHFGSAKKIVTDMNQTHIIGGGGQDEKIQARLREIARMIAQEPSPGLKGAHRDRLTRLNSKVAEIEVGGGTDAEKGEVRDLIVDSLNSAKSAMQHGILPGGGVALYQAAKILEGGLPELVSEESERLGVMVMHEALKRPIRAVIENKTGETCGHIIEKIEREGSFFAGYDVKNQRVCDMVESGVVDSYSVVKSILQDSVSLAGMLITTECLVVKDKNYEPLSLKHYQDKREFF